jgi:dipeptidyl aminopeptidase/acylaminoacyl peptidase
MSEKAIHPYGSWPSPITAELVAGASMKLTFPMLGLAVCSWVETRPEEGGRAVVCSQYRELSDPTVDAKSRVHEYGGVAHTFAGERLILRPKVGDFRLAEPCYDSLGKRLIAVGEHHAAGGPPDRAHPENGLVSVDLETDAVSWVVRGHDFFASPVLSPDGETLAFLAWNDPHMPWEAAAVYTAAVGRKGAIGEPVRVAGGADGSAFSPMWSDDGDLYFALEAEGRPWNIHRLRDGRVERVHTSDDEWGAPLWNLGTTIFGFDQFGHIIGAPMAEGRSKLVRLDLATGEEEVLIEDLGHIGHLSVHCESVLMTQGWAGSGSRLLHYDAGTRNLRTLRDVKSHLFEGPNAILSDDDVPTAESVTFPTSDGDVAHGFFYAPTSATAAGPAKALPPLVVLCHGGPTGVATPLPSLGVMQFTTRGYAVLDVNYRGSTGFGRAYREKLRGRWGQVDVDDCVYGARAMAERGKADGARLTIRGGSAGGYTLLLALAKHPDAFAVATCLYGVSDPRSLTTDTHKFEAPYANYLFGTGEARERAFRERSPLELADRIKTPVIFFQGLDDKAVVPAQTERIFAALRENGVASEMHLYAGEGHGFKKAETIRDVFDKETAFYAHVLGAGARP